MLGLDLSNYLNKIISVFWIILLINSINFVDNMDGLASVVTGSICIQIIILTYGDPVEFSHTKQNKRHDRNHFQRMGKLGDLERRPLDQQR